jgi:hypothetical protein
LHFRPAEKSRLNSVVSGVSHKSEHEYLRLTQASGVWMNSLKQGTKQCCLETASRLAPDANAKELTTLICQAEENSVNTKEQFNNSTCAGEMHGAERELAVFICERHEAFKAHDSPGHPCFLGRNT